jgi:polyphosphate glucokinase
MSEPETSSDGIQHDRRERFRLGALLGRQPMKILVIDVGGTNVKAMTAGQDEVRKIPSGTKMTAAQMVQDVLAATKDWEYDAISIGYPGVVVDGVIRKEPVNLGPGWVGFDFAAAFGRPVRIMNDAAMQALGSYQGGRMLFLGLGTGLGTAMVLDGCVVPMEGGHLPYRNGRSFEAYVGERGMKKLGRKRWRRAVKDIIQRLQDAFIVDDVVLSGGNAKKLKRLPPGTRLGDNRNAFQGGLRLWEKR